MTRTVVVAMCAVLVAAAPSSAAPPEDRGPDRSSYVVVLTDDTAREAVPDAASELARAHGGRLGPVYRFALKGFAVELT